MKSKIVTSLLMLTLLFTLAPIAVPVNAQPPTITFLIHWNGQEQVWQWGNITERYYNETGVHVEVQSVNMSIFHSTILSRHAVGDDPDMIHMHCVWLPEFCTIDDGAGMLATPPDDVTANIQANWTTSSIEAATFLNQTWGYPTEYNAYALVYNKYLLNQSGYSEGTGAGQYPPKNWTELLEMGTATTQRDEAGVINVTGFLPVWGTPYYEGEKYQFLSFLWLNGGEFIQLPPPEKAVKFNETEGREVLQNLYIDTINVTYDPAHTPNIWWDAWMWPWKLNFVVLPNWMRYFIKPGMGANFTSDYIGIAPIPPGPNGTTPVSSSYNWMAVTTKKAEERGKAGLCWDFYRWLFSPEPGKTTSRMGEFLIWSSIIPSRIADQADPRLQSDFWFKAFMDIGAAYGRSDLYFKTGEAVQTCMGQMLEAVTIGGKSIDDPEYGLQATATKVYNLLPVEEPAFIATLLSPANLYITDPENRHIGTDPTTGQPVNEIPDAFYTGPGSEPQQIIIPHPLNGVYDIVIIGTANGTYTLLIELATLSNATTEIYTGTIVSGEILKSEAIILEGEMTATQPSPPDIAVTNVTPNIPGKTKAGQGLDFRIKATVQNQGNSTETFHVTCYANNVTVGKQQTTLAPGASTTLTFTWDTTGVPKGYYTLKATADTVPGETNTTNNTFTDGIVQVVMPGDITADGKVNVYDLREIAKAYGTKIGQPRYNPDADIKEDGKVALFDLVYIARNYGKTDP